MNPFETFFGKEPKEYVPRYDEIRTLVQSFDDGVTQCYLITGVRGTGKTVMMSHVANIYKDMKDWLVVDINPEKDIIISLVAKLYSLANLSKLFINKELSIGVHGINLTLASGQKIVDAESILEIMLKELSRQNKKLLVTIDEVTNTKDMRVFVHTFQSLVRDNQPIYLIMTGLPENVCSLQNEKTLTFLYRSPKISLMPLNDSAIMNKYMNVFKNVELAKEMTILVKGYAYAYQLLGSIMYDSKKGYIDDIVLEEYDYALANTVYEKVWSDLNATDKSILRSILVTDGTTAEIMKNLDMKKNAFSVYRDRLKQKGYVDTSVRGVLDFSLPRFDKFLEKYDF